MQVPSSLSSAGGAVRRAERPLVVSLDVGTSASGFAAVHRKQPQRVVLHEHWPEAPQPYPKTLSALLYKDRTPIAWGWEAYKQYLALPESEVGHHHYIKNFKLGLYDPEFAKPIIDMGLRPEQVMADYLQSLFIYTKQQLRKGKKFSEADLSNIQWVLSVPALWDDRLKDLMRTAAYRAGIITMDRYDDSLQLILEPEAAALHARLENAPPLSPGMTVAVLDVGGGTADMSVHNVELRGGQAVLADALYAVGEAVGGVVVDDAFWAYYSQAVGEAAFKHWAQKYGPIELQVLGKWLAVKHNWAGPASGAAKSSGHMHRVFIPPSLLALMDPADRKHLSTEQRGVDSDVLLDDPLLKQMFDVSVDPVLEMATEQLTELKGQRCDQLILVGGFAASPYLQDRTRQQLVTDTKLTKQVVVPPFPHAAVVKGAALYGCNPELIRARRTRLSYGIQLAAPYEDGAPGRFWNDEEGCFWTDSVYAKMVDKNQEVPQDEEVTHYVTPLAHDQTSASIQLYATDRKDVRYITHGDDSLRRVATLELTLPDTPQDTDMPTICVRLKFGKAEIQATATDLSTGKDVKTQFKFRPAA